MPTITQLEYIAAVDRTRHFGKAAKECHISQPSLSMQIQKAEELLGVLIFDRDKKPVLPTEKGARIIEQAKEVLRAHAKLLHMSKDESMAISGTFRLGVIPTLAPYLIPPLVGKFVKAFPRVDLIIDEMKTDDIVTALHGDQIDAGLLATPLNEAHLRERIMFYEPFYLYANAQHPILKKSVIRESDLNPDDVWLLQDGHCFRNQVINFCTVKNTNEHSVGGIRFEGGNFETLRNLIRTTRGYTLFPHLFVASLSGKERESVVRPLSKPSPTREISLVHRRGHWKADIIGALEQTMRDALPKELFAFDEGRVQPIVKPEAV